MIMSKNKENNARFAALLNEKKVQWDKIKLLLAATNNNNTTNTTNNNANNNDNVRNESTNANGNNATTTTIKTTTTKITGSLCRQALEKSCLDPFVCKETIELLLAKMDPPFDRIQRVKLVMAAVRCRNTIALSTLIRNDATGMLLYGEVGATGRRHTLLHLVCEKHGWNKEVQLILQETLRNKMRKKVGTIHDSCHYHDHDDDAHVHHHHHAGMFQLNLKMQSPLQLSLQAGGDLKEVIDYVKREYPCHFENNVQFLPKIIAEYSDDMSILQDLIQSHPQIVSSSSSLSSRKKEANAASTTSRTTLTTTNNTGKAVATPLHYACYYQNQGMIRTLLEHCQNSKKEGGLGEKRKKIIKRLLATTTNNDNNNDNRKDNDNDIDDDDENSSIALSSSPLGYLVLGLGSTDAENAFECVRMIQNIVDDLPILHIIIDKMWEGLVKSKKCLRTTTRIIDRLYVDLMYSDDHGRTILSLLIAKMAPAIPKNKTKKKKKKTTKSKRTNRKAKKLQQSDSSPFHLTNASNSTEESKAKLLEAKAVLRYILSKNNETARLTDRTKKHLPLHVACENGLSWEDGIDLLVDANVSALEQFDSKTALLPFALAATDGPGVPCDVNTIYQLLRYHPGVMKCMIQTC